MDAGSLIAAVCCLGSLAMLTWILYSLLRESEFGVVVFMAELPFILSCTVYPVLIMFGLISPGLEGSLYVSNHGVPGLGVSIHVFLYSLGGLAGYHYGRKMHSASGAQWLLRVSERAVPNPSFWVRPLLLGLFIWLAFFQLVGVEVALANAVRARSGVFDGFGEDVRWLFLKTLASSFMFCACAVPVFLKDFGKYWHLFAIYCVLVILVFVNSISRSSILNYLLVPMAVYVYSRKSVPLFLIAFAIGILIAAPVLLFGKSAGQWISAMAEGRSSIEFEVYLTSSSVLESYLRNVEFTWYSVQAGISHFFQNGGSYFPLDVLASLLFGIFPSRVLDAIGLGALSYSGMEVDERLACVNTAQFSSGMDCTIPPLWIGYSAYLLPFGGGLLFGFFRFFIFGRISKVWVLVKKIDYEKIWLVYFIALTSMYIMSLVPTAISQAVFMVMLVMLLRFINVSFSSFVSVSDKKTVLHSGGGQ